MTEEELKQWLKDNLIIEAKLAYPYESGNDVRISLRFIGEKNSFTDDLIHIPEPDPHRNYY